MTIYEKSLSLDFEGNLNVLQFSQEIQNSNITSAILQSVGYSADIVHIVFNDELSEPDLVILNTLISNHVPDNSKPKINSFTVNVNKTAISTIYSRLATFKYEGYSKKGIIDYIEVSAYSDATVSNYAIKIYDKTNNQTIVEKTGLTNKNLEFIDLGLISNVAKNESLIEIQAKGTNATSSRKVYIENVVVYYNN